jgi:tRNA (cytidine/uridine-2'-O-)-methyltransferase
MSYGLNVVLVEPEIPQNTGSIGRLCLATGTTLHLVEPLGFEITDAHLRRAGLDYWEHLKVVRHSSLEAFMAQLPKDAPKVFLSKKAGHTLFEHRFVPGTWLVFGKETMGLPDSILNSHPTETIRIPLYDARVRSLNLSNAVSIAVYEAIRQLGP